MQSVLTRRFLLLFFYFLHFIIIFLGDLGTQESIALGVSLGLTTFILSFIGFFLCRALYLDRGVNFKVKDVDKVSIIFVISLHHATMARKKLRRHHYHYHYY